MKLVEDSEIFEDLQMELAFEMIKSIQSHLGKLALDEEQKKILVQKMAFSICCILDGSQVVELDGQQLRPILAFHQEEETLIWPGGAAWTHEAVMGLVDELFEGDT